ncbi:helix-turn-helix domain-containing protein [Mycobacteroides chelonae]|nr:helix-turn-helix domain-containing protein [Mycobacteroides chelonae]MBF9422625.1 helix-turn-helix domain-containing protein [Mycobacteroides chelonae]
MEGSNLMVRQDAAFQTLGQQLRYLRKAAGQTATHTAEQIGVSNTHLSNIEHGRDRPSAKIIAYYEQHFDGHGQAWGLFEALLTAERPVQRFPLSEQPDYPIPGDASAFVADITIPDGTLLAPYQQFTKIWRIRNSGTVQWENRWLARRGAPTGHGIPSSPAKVPIPDTEPGQEVDITVPMRAQPLTGSSQMHWKMVDDQGWEYFPDRYNLGLVVSIVVTVPHCL